MLTIPSRRLSLLALLPALLLLAGCGEEMKKTFGLGKNPPDEFQVVRRAPLALPPDFSLRPPAPGAPRPQEDSPTEQARRAVLDPAAQVAPPRPVDPAAPAAAPRTPVSGFSLGGAVPQAARAAPAMAARSASQPDPFGPSEGEINLLRQAGAERTPPNIRSAIDEDLTKMADADTRFIDRLLVWRKSEVPASILDARKESQRLQENAALGKPATEGETPTIKRKSKGIFEGLF
jgi:hypothetical protein